MNQWRLRPLFLLPIVLLAMVSLPTSASAGPDHRKIVASDDCDPATFNAAFGDGVCVGDGRTTLPDFFAQLAVTPQEPNEAVKDWDFSRENFDIDAGGTLTIISRGGEFHTFTEVAEFGGGCVDPRLNGGVDPVPECADFPTLAFTTGFPAGGTLTVPLAGLAPGEHKFQCLIHPWMQSTANIDN